MGVFYLTAPSLPPSLPPSLFPAFPYKKKWKPAAVFVSENSLERITELPFITSHKEQLVSPKTLIGGVGSYWLIRTGKTTHLRLSRRSRAQGEMSQRRYRAGNLRAHSLKNSSSIPHCKLMGNIWRKWLRHLIRNERGKVERRHENLK